MADDLEERHVARRVGVGSRLPRSMPSAAASSPTTSAFARPSSRRTRRPVQAVLDLGFDRAPPSNPSSATSTSTISCKCGGHDERAFPALAVPRDEVERIPIDVWLERRVHGLPDDLTHLLHTHAFQECHRALGGLPDPRRPGAVAHEHELSDPRLRAVAPRAGALADGTPARARASSTARSASGRGRRTRRPARAVLGEDGERLANRARAQRRDRLRERRNRRRCLGVGATSATGQPSSAASRITGSSGMRARSGTPISSASA